MTGYGYQWRHSAGCCKADQIEAGNVAPECPSSYWFWLLAAAAIGTAVLWPVKRRAA